jgi:hypothetical protein
MASARLRRSTEHSQATQKEIFEWYLTIRIKKEKL